MLCLFFSVTVEAFGRVENRELVRTGGHACVDGHAHTEGARAAQAAASPPTANHLWTPVRSLCNPSPRRSPGARKCP